MENWKYFMESGISQNFNEFRYNTMKIISSLAYNCGFLYVEYSKKDTNGLICKTETESQTLKNF